MFRWDGSFRIEPGAKPSEAAKDLARSWKIITRALRNSGHAPVSFIESVNCVILQCDRDFVVSIANDCSSVSLIHANGCVLSIRNFKDPKRFCRLLSRFMKFKEMHEKLDNSVLSYCARTEEDHDIMLIDLCFLRIDVMKIECFTLNNGDIEHRSIDLESMDPSHVKEVADKIKYRHEDR